MNQKIRVLESWNLINRDCISVICNVTLGLPTSNVGFFNIIV